jgi:hypothetical protein
VLTSTSPTGWKVIGSSNSVYSVYVVCTG